MEKKRLCCSVLHGLAAKMQTRDAHKGKDLREALGWKKHPTFQSWKNILLRDIYCSSDLYYVYYSIIRKVKKHQLVSDVQSQILGATSSKMLQIIGLSQHHRYALSLWFTRINHESWRYPSCLATHSKTSGSCCHCNHAMSDSATSLEWRNWWLGGLFIWFVQPRWLQVTILLETVWKLSYGISMCAHWHAARRKKKRKHWISTQGTVSARKVSSFRIFWSSKCDVSTISNKDVLCLIEKLQKKPWWPEPTPETASEIQLLLSPGEWRHRTIVMFFPL